MSLELYLLIMFLSVLVTRLGGKLLRKWINFVAEKTGGKKLPSTIPSVTFELSAGGAAIFESLKMVFGSSKSFKIKYVSNEKLLIKLSAGITLDSWGEVICIKVIPVGSEKSNLEISSRPKLRAVLFDGGKNQKNLDEIAAIIKSTFRDCQPRAANV